MKWKFDHVDYNELGNVRSPHDVVGAGPYYQYYLPKGLTITAYR